MTSSRGAVRGSLIHRLAVVACGARRKFYWLMAGGSHSRTARTGIGLCVAGAALGVLGLLDAVAKLGLLSAIVPREAA